MKDICAVAGFWPGNVRDGSIEYYLSEPIVCNNQKGSGTFIMAYAQKLLLEKEDMA